MAYSAVQYRSNRHSFFWSQYSKSLKHPGIPANLDVEEGSNTKHVKGIYSRTVHISNYDCHEHVRPVSLIIFYHEWLSR